MKTPVSGLFYCCYRCTWAVCALGRGRCWPRGADADDGAWRVDTRSPAKGTWDTEEDGAQLCWSVSCNTSKQWWCDCEFKPDVWSWWQIYHLVPSVREHILTNVLVEVAKSEFVLLDLLSTSTHFNQPRPLCHFVPVVVRVTLSAHWHVVLSGQIGGGVGDGDEDDWGH